jgi:type I restriction enzyme, R subunit
MASSMTREGSSLEDDFRREIVHRLQAEVAAMNFDNFVVRPRRRLVEKYATADAWMG